MLLTDILRESYWVNLCCEPDNFQKISLYLSYVLLLLKNCLTTVPVVICPVAISVLLLLVRNIGKDFRCPLWIPCLLLIPFHPKNTWYTHVKCYADISAFYNRYGTRVRVRDIV